MYLIIVLFLLSLAVFDLFVGVSNDAVNFLQSAVGARVAKYRTVIIIASAGVIFGAMMSSGMMDVARHVIMVPSQYSFSEVMTVFLAVMVTDVVILDMFNTLGMPTSTTVSLVFELLGGTFALACVKMFGDHTLAFSDLLNTDKALSVILAIFVSVAVAFIFGLIVMWISRIVFTFNYEKHLRYSVAIFGGIAFTTLAYFIFLQGIGKSPYIPAEVSAYIKEHTSILLLWTFLVSTVIMEVLHLLRVNVFSFVVLMGTFALAMAFAGNDLVNFIGVPLAGLDSYQDFVAHANGADPHSFMMTSLMESAKTPVVYLALAGAIMIIAMATSKKAQNVIKTSVDLSRQDEGDEMFGSSRAARALVRSAQDMNGVVTDVVPDRFMRWLDRRFDRKEVEMDNKAAFDVVRAAVNLVLASMLITIGTNYHLPLSTTYVTFMVAMGSSLADRAWGRESAVFRVTGVMSVIGGWFITAGVAFIAAALVCVVMYFGGMPLKVIFMALVVYMLIRSQRQYNKKSEESTRGSSFQLMMRTHDPDLVWDMLQRQVTRTQAYVCRFALEEFNRIVDGFEKDSVKELRRCNRELKEETDELKKYRRQEMLALKRCPPDVALERNTWFHLGANSNQQIIYSLRRMLEPIKEHVENNFNPVPSTFIEEYTDIRHKVNDMMKKCADVISTGHYETYRDILAEADRLKDDLSVVRKRHLDRIQRADGTGEFQVSVVYLNLLQESQQFLSAMRHLLRASKKFME